MRLGYFYLLPLLMVFFSFKVFAQSYTKLDTTFNSIDVGGGFGDGPYGHVSAISIQPDEKIIIGGVFEVYNDTLVNGITRLNPDGSIDQNFNNATGVKLGTSWGSVITTLVQPDGKIIIGGQFDKYNNQSANYITRLNSNGSIDVGFNTNNGANNIVNKSIIQPDGKIIIAGRFTQFNMTSRNHVARLNTDGSLDASFLPGSGTDGVSYTVDIQLDGKIIIGGDFSTYNGIARKNIVRVNSNGSIDNTFNPGTGADSSVNTVSIQADGKIIIGGLFTTYNGVVSNHIARLNTDGTLDSTFNSGTGANVSVSKTSIQADGKIIIGGGFTTYNGVSRNRIARLNPDGSLDNTFDVGSGANDGVNPISIQSDGKILVGGAFYVIDGIYKRHLTRLNSNGSFDVSFNQGTGANTPVGSISIQSDGKILVGGGFTLFNGEIKKSIVRFNLDGSLDTSFNIGTGLIGGISASKIQSDGKIIIAGSFTSFNGTTRNGVARLNSDGSLDTSFNPGAGAPIGIYSMDIQLDGKIILGGQFLNYNSGSTKNRIVRLNTNGSLDPVFNSGTGPNGYLNQVLIQPDGKVIIVGYFTSYNGFLSKNIARLDTNGNFDSSFIIGTGPNDIVESCAIRPDGKIVVGGRFTSYNGIPINGIVRLNSDGSIDTTFNSGTGVDYLIYSIAIQPDGKILIGGKFTTYDGIQVGCIARLNTDGSLDNTFDSEIGFELLKTSPNVRSIAIQSDRKIIVGGDFTRFNGKGANRIARIINCDVVPEYTYVDNNNGNYSFSNYSLGNFNKFHWAFGDGSVSKIENPNHTFIANSSYPVVLTINDSALGGTCINYFIDTITVTGVSSPATCLAGFVMYPDTVENVILINTSIGGNLSYLWDFGDGATSTLQLPTHVYSTAGPYQICLTVDDGIGCIDQYCDSIGEKGVVFNKQGGFVLNVVNLPLTTQLNELNTLPQQLMIYPNPTGNVLNITMTERKPNHIRIFTTEGKLIDNKTFVGSIQLNVFDYPRGMYFISLINEEGQIYQNKFIKE
jgi:uncharacterized delta-60 repeat protein